MQINPFEIWSSPVKDFLKLLNTFPNIVKFRKVSQISFAIEK